jgi:hypothetical protein
MRMGPEQIDALARREFSDPVEWSYYALAGWFPSVLPGLPQMSASDNRVVNLSQVRPLMNMVTQLSNFTERVPRSEAEEVLGERLCTKVFRVPEDYSDLSGGMVRIGGPARDLSPITATATEMIMHFRKVLLDHPLPE